VGVFFSIVHFCTIATVSSYNVALQRTVASTMADNDSNRTCPSSVSPPPEKKQKTGRPSKAVNFCEEEDVALCKAFVNMSTDPISGADRKSAQFWADIKIKFETALKQEVDPTRLEKLPERTQESLKTVSPNKSFEPRTSS
jgi:hypothetical protein